MYSTLVRGNIYRWQPAEHVKHLTDDALRLDADARLVGRQEVDSHVPDLLLATPLLQWYQLVSHVVNSKV